MVSKGPRYFEPAERDGEVREKQLVELGPCRVCSRPLFATGAPMFYLVRITRCMGDVGNLRRRVGMAHMMGGGVGGDVLAQVMGPDAPLARKFVESEVVVHEECAMNVGHLVQLMAREPEETEKPDDE